jgi:hypothetical protein
MNPLLRKQGLVLLLAAAMLLAAVESAHPSDESIDPGSWVYPALHTFELLGLVRLAPSVPYSRGEVQRYVDAIVREIESGRVVLTPRQDFLVGRLRAEFSQEALSPDMREDPPILTVREGENFFSIDASLGGVVRKRIDRDKGQADGILVPTLLLGFGNDFTIETDYLIKLSPERDLNRRTQKPSPRERSWRGLTSEYRRGYIAFSGRKWRLKVGRDYIGWGGLYGDGLITSTSAGSHDHVHFDISLGRFTLRAFQAVLDSGLPRRLAGHRLEVRLPRRITAGITETVLYTMRDLEWSYLLPFGSFYGNQYNEEVDDNVLWSVDVRIPVRKGLILAGELLIDDFQYESDPPGPNRIGLTAKMGLLLHPWGHDLEMEAVYTRINIHTYAHKDSLLTTYVTGNGDKTVNSIIGSQLGPDAERAGIRIATPVHPRAVLAVTGAWSRMGEGNDLREWDRVSDPNPPFPSGDVKTEKTVAALLEIDLSRGSIISVGGGMQRTSDGGATEDWTFAHLAFTWDF